MILSLACIELRVLRRDPRAGWMLLTLAALILLAFAMTTWNNVRGNAEKHSVADAERTRWLQQGQKDAHSAAHYSIYAFKPGAALSLLDSGIEPFVGQAVWLEAHVQNDMLYRAQGDYSALQRAGLTHPAALLNTFAPLAAFLLAFTVIALDRERGTLRFALGAALSPQRIVQSKYLAVCTLLIGLLAAPVTFAALLTTMLQQTLTTDVFLRVGLWALTMSIYLVALAAIGMTVCLLSTNIRIALLALIGLWIVLAIALPRWSSSAVEKMQPLPAFQSIKQQIQRETAGSSAHEVSAEREQMLLKKYGVSRREDLPVDLRGVMLDMAERHGYEVFDRILGGFYDRIEAQDRAFAAWSFLSPSIALHSVSMALAGTDFTHHRRFIESAEHYRRDLINRMNAELMTDPHNEQSPARPLADHHLWEQVSAFQYSAPMMGQVWRTALRAGSALIGWLLLAIALLNVAMRRVRP